MAPDASAVQVDVQPKPSGLAEEFSGDKGVSSQLPEALAVKVFK